MKLRKLDPKAPWYDRKGNSISLEEWGELLQDKDYSRVGYDKIGIWEISTVWIGLGLGGLHIFETMLFAHDFTEGFTYATEEEAEIGHKAIVFAIESVVGVAEAPIEGWVLVS